MQRLEVSGAVRHIYASLGFKGLKYIFSKMGVFGLNLVAPRKDLVMGCCECGNDLSGVYLTGNLFNSRTSIN